MKRSLVVAVAVGALALAAGFACLANDCTDLLPPKANSLQKRAITADDLLRLRDFGSLDAVYPGDVFYDLSPDRSHIAIQIRQAQPDTNSYCVGLLVLPLARPADARLIDTGGDLIRIPTEGAGFAALPSGMPQNLIPKWSPEGQWLAYLRRDAGVTQLWRARADGSEAGPVTHGAVDVEDFAWADAGQSLTFTSRPALLEQQAAVDREGLGGYLYDDRYIPLRGSKPWVRGPLAEAHFKIDLKSNSTKEFSVLDSEVAKPAPADKTVEVLLEHEDGKGGFVRVETEQAGRPRPMTYLVARRAKGPTVRCDAEPCRAAKAAWLSPTSPAVYFLNQEPQQPKLGLYRWDLKSQAPKRILDTEDALGSCELVGGRLVCVRETSILPRHFANIDLETGKSSVLFDLNPEFQSVELGTVQRLRWTNSFGIETFGDLVLPPGNKAGKPLPLIIVGYYSRGFLRGGTGDEYPIQLYAANGFAVLSFHRPISIGWVRGGKTYDEISAIDRKDYADRRSVQSSLETGIDLLSRMGIVDDKRVGLTGFSDGASTAQFALVNSDRFSAMAVSSCCENAIIVNALVGPAIGGWLNSLGYPTFTAADTSYWDAFAVQPNLAKVHAPLLIQTSDDEYLGSLADLAALRELGKPAEMHVFEGEHHVKWQPAHRSAAYERSLDWFDFWLNGKEDPDPSKAGQYLRWRELRNQENVVTSTSPGE